MTLQTAGFWNALTNGLRRKCPRCGEGPVLDGWMTVRERCPACGLVYERNAGDTWGFWVILDRIPLAIAIAVVYFGLGPHSWTGGVVLLAGFGILQIATIPQRLGFVVALDYMTQLWWPDREAVDAARMSSDQSPMSKECPS